MAADLAPIVALLDEMELYRLNRLEGASLGLYEGPHTPNANDTLTTYQAIETTFGGYAEVVLGGWSASAVGGPGVQTTSPLATFTPSGSPGTHTVTGYFLFKGLTVLGAGLLAASIVVAPSVAFHLVAQRTLASP